MAKDTPETQAVTLPWYVLINPFYYDDSEDRGYGWEGEATDRDDAVRQACLDCDSVNDRDEADGDKLLNPETVEVWDARPDCQKLAADVYRAWKSAPANSVEIGAAMARLRLGLIGCREIGAND